MHRHNTQHQRHGEHRDERRRVRRRHSAGDEAPRRNGIQRRDDTHVAEVGTKHVVRGDAVRDLASDHGDGSAVGADELHRDQRIVRKVADERRR